MKKLLLTLAFILVSISGVMAQTVVGAFTVTGNTSNYSFTGTTESNGIFTITGNGVTVAKTVYNAPTSDIIVVNSSSAITLTLAGVNIKAPPGKKALDVQGTGATEIILANGTVNTLIGGDVNYGLTREDLVGTYSFDGKSLMNQPLEISKSNIVITNHATDPDKVLISGLGMFLVNRLSTLSFNTTGAKPISAIVDGVNVKILIPHGQSTGIIHNHAAGALDLQIWAITPGGTIGNATELTFTSAGTFSYAFVDGSKITGPYNPNEFRYRAIRPSDGAGVDIESWDFFTASRYLATPTITPNGGTFASSQEVTLASTTADATIYYTLDGSDPTVASILYSASFTVSANTIVKAIATHAGYLDSEIATSAVFTSAPPVVE